MRPIESRRATAILFAVSLGSLLAFAPGCAIDPSFGSTRTRPAPQPKRNDEYDARRAYEAGWQAGRRDDEDELRPDYTRYERSYDWSTERSFAAGYRDGYAGDADRYEPKKKKVKRDHDHDDHDSVGVVSSVPSWLVGDYRGWSEPNEANVAVSVRPNASVLLVADGRQSRGVYRSGQVHFGSAAYAVKRLRDGVRFTHVGDSRRTLVLQRLD